MKMRNQVDSPGSCSLIRRVPDYLLKELPPEERRAFDAHVATCPVCRRAMDSFGAVIGRMQKIPKVACGRNLAEEVLARLPTDAWTPARRSFWRTVFSPMPLGIAAALLVVAGVASLLLHRDSLPGTGGGHTLAAALPEAPPLPANLTDTDTQAATLQNARRWLQKAQTPEGGWTAGRLDARKDHAVGVSSLALLALMDGNPSVLHSPCASTVRRGVSYLISLQNEQGLIGPRVEGAPYNQGLATLAILDAYALESNALWKAAADKALNFLCAAQISSGGWGYLKSSLEPANTSASIWPLQALLRADDLGFPGLRPPIERGLTWLRTAVDQDGIMGYSRAGDVRYGQDTMTAAGLVCFLKDNHGTQRPAVRGLLPVLRRIAARQNPKTDFYRMFFVATAVDLASGEQSTRTLAAITGRLASLQNAGGNWNADDPWGGIGGSVYSTAMATLALECD